MKFSRSVLGTAAAALLACIAAPASAQSFVCLTNDSGQCPAVASQVAMTVSDLGSNQVAFKFDNNGPVASSITDVYWEASALTGTVSINDSGSGVSFSWGASPPNPGGGAGWNAEFDADSNFPTAFNGVNPGEWVRFVFNYSGTFASLLGGINDNSSHVALHVQAIGTSGESDWIQTTTPPVPEPETYALMLAGLGVVGFMARRRRQQA